MATHVEVDDLFILKIFPELKMVSIRNYFYIREIGILLNLPNIPPEIIHVINKLLLNHELDKTHIKNQCPCTEKECIIKWTSSFNIGTDLTVFQHIGHCKTENCHIILDTRNSVQCIDCSQYLCNECVPFKIQLDNLEFINESFVCTSCSKLMAVHVGFIFNKM